MKVNKIRFNEYLRKTERLLDVYHARFKNDLGFENLEEEKRAIVRQTLCLIDNFFMDEKLYQQITSIFHVIDNAIAKITNPNSELNELEKVDILYRIDFASEYIRNYRWFAEEETNNY